MSDVPCVDVAPFVAGNAAQKTRIANQVRDACETIGFLVIEGHGVPDSLYARVLDVSLEFFDLPEDEKAKSLPPHDTVPRGYQRFATRRLAITRGIETPPDLREQFFMGPLEDRRPDYRAIPEALPFFEPNIWPEQPTEFREVFEQVYEQHERLAGILMRIFARALTLPEDYFEDKINRHFSTGTSSHYPAQRAAWQPGQLRCGEHTDFGSLTILRPGNGASGLQVQNGEGVWSEVRSESGQLIINLGDMMQQWTNDRWRSTVHRVVNPDSFEASTARQSIAFFLHPNYDTPIECIESCVERGRQPKYPRIRAGDWMREKLIRRTT